MADDTDIALIRSDNLRLLEGLPDASVDLIYADPPFNTGGRRRLARRTMAAGGDHRGGFAGRSYHVVERADELSYADSFEDYLGWLRPRLAESRRVLRPHGSLYLHLDSREAHYCKVLLDEVFGRDCFLNEIIWAYDYGGRSARRWAAKHDTILVYVVDRGRYHFDTSEVDRLPYAAPSLQTPERRLRGKLPTDVWWHTIVPTSSRERTGYPTQKPLGIVRRVIAASSRPGDVVLDWCAGSGTTGAACRELGRHAMLVDNNPEALQVMRRRLAPIRDLELDQVGEWLSRPGRDRVDAVSG